MELTDDPSDVEPTIRSAAGGRDADPTDRGDGPRTVLVIEDDDEVRRVARLSLESHGLRVLAAEDGISGLELFEAHAGEISMVLLDLTMPRMNGAEVYRQLARSNPELPVLLMSGYSDDGSIVPTGASGPWGFLQKPFTVQQLMDSCRQALG